MSDGQPAKHPGGRPTVWNDELEAEIIENIEVGLPDKVSVSAAGISYPTFLTHCEKFPEFLDRIQRARDVGMAKVAKEAATTTDPVRLKYCLRRLACRVPDDFSETRKVQHSGSIVDALAKAIANDPGELPES